MCTAPTLLTLDTALNGCSAGIFKGTPENGYYEDKAMARGQAEALWPMIERVRNQAGIAYHHIDGVAVTCGPGNFTGLRIALTAARTFCRMQALPAYGLSTAHSIAFRYCCNQQGRAKTRNCDVLVALDTKRGDYYTQAFSANCKALEQPTIRHAQAIYALLQANTHTLLIGHGLEDVVADAPESLTGHIAHAQLDMRPMPEMMAAMCFGGYVQAGVSDDLHPVYMREAETSLVQRKK